MLTWFDCAIHWCGASLRASSLFIERLDLNRPLKAVYAFQITPLF
jgi:hypothetical protein